MDSCHFSFSDFVGEYSSMEIVVQPNLYVILYRFLGDFGV